MANAILYNQGSHPTGALKSGTMSMNVSPSLNVGALKWRNGFENNNMWVIYSDTYSQGQATQGNALPTIWASSTFTDDGLVNLINTLPARAGQIPFTNVTAATSWLRGQGVYFLSNQNYPQIVTSGLTMMMDAGFPASFPNGTGTTWYDVCGNDNNGTLNNGPTWVNSGTTSYLSFDGTDDYITFSQVPTLTNQLTMECLFYMNTIQLQSQNRLISNADNYVLYFNDSTDLRFYMGSHGGDITTSGTFINNWRHIVATYNGTTRALYVDGVLKTTSSASGNINNGNILNIGAYQNQSVYTFNGRMNQVRIYNRGLSQSEILQNYYNGPIVTSGLTLALDAGNLVSYGGTGTSWKDLTANAFNGTLTNGPTYSSDSGGCIVFDGSDDYVTIPINSAFNTPSVTYEVWANLQTINDRHILYVNWQGNSLEIYADRSVRFYNYSNTQGQQGSQTDSNVFNWDTWVHFVGIYDDASQTLKSYANGVLLATRTNTPSTTYSVGVHKISGTDYGGEVKGKISIVRHYNRALSDAEVQQNYNAQRGRFGI
jgi:hypothetical protein